MKENEKNLNIIEQPLSGLLVVENIESREERLWAEQVNRLVEMGCHTALGITEEEYKSTLPSIEKPPQEYIGIYDNPLIVETRFKNSGFINHAHLPEPYRIYGDRYEVDYESKKNRGKNIFGNFIADLIETDQKPYLVWTRNPDYERKKMPKREYLDKVKTLTAGKDDTERGLTFREGVNLLLHYPEWITNGGLNFTSSRVYMPRYDGYLELGIPCLASIDCFCCVKWKDKKKNHKYELEFEYYGAPTSYKQIPTTPKLTSQLASELV